MARAGQFGAAIALVALVGVLWLTGLHQHQVLQGPAPKPSHVSTSVLVASYDAPLLRVKR
jgi:hypothetical protein